MKDLYPDIPHIERLDHGPLRDEALSMQIMISHYCKKNHHTTHLCPQCEHLLEYCLKRLACCPFQQEKPTCRNCKIHCYGPREKEAIKCVMRTSGPALLLSNPILSFKHLIKGFKKAPEKPRNPRRKPKSDSIEK